MSHTSLLTSLSLGIALHMLVPLIPFLWPHTDLFASLSPLWLPAPKGSGGPQRIMISFKCALAEDRSKLHLGWPLG
jgi:hypothetical protein